MTSTSFPDVIFLFFGASSPSGIIDSQVLRLLPKIKERGVALEAVTVDGYRDRRADQTIWLRRRKLLEEVGLRRQYIIPGFRYRFIFEVFRHIFRLDIWLNARSKERFVLHCRTDLAVYLAGKVKKLTRNAKIIFDMRGDIPSEYLYDQIKAGADSRSDEIQKEYSRLVERERYAVEHADHILCVSEKMRSSLLDKYAIPEQNCTVNPCAADETIFHFDPTVRKKIRSQLGLEHEWVLVYSGSTRPWQLPEEMIETFRLCLAVEPDVHFLWLTPDLEKANGYLSQRVPEDKYTTLSVTQEEVAAYLMAGDAGLLLREKSPVNQVASPVKFAEYLMSGLSVIITSGIGDTEEIVREHQLGIIFENLCDKQNLQVKLEHFIRASANQNDSKRLEISQKGQELFSIDSNVDRLVALYEKLLNQNS